MLNRLASPSESYKVSLLDAIHTLAASWDSVQPQTIANCFRKAGFCVSDEQNNNDSAAATGELDDGVGRSSGENEYKCII